MTATWFPNADGKCAGSFTTVRISPVSAIDTGWWFGRMWSWRNQIPTGEYDHD